MIRRQASAGGFHIAAIRFLPYLWNKATPRFLREFEMMLLLAAARLGDLIDNTWIVPRYMAVRVTIY